MGYLTKAVGVLVLVKRPDGGGWIGPAILVAAGLFVPLRLLGIAFAQQKNSRKDVDRFLQPTAWEFGPESVSVRSPHWQGQYLWAAFTHWREGPGVFLLYRTPEQYHVLPKRAFADRRDVATLQRILGARVLPPLNVFPVVPNPMPAG